MNIDERIAQLYRSYRDCGAAIDAARVLATITNTDHVLYFNTNAHSPRFTDVHTNWHVLGIGDKPGPTWKRIGGIYSPREERAHMQTDPSLTPERWEARNVFGTDLDAIADEYAALVRGGPRQYERCQ